MEEAAWRRLLISRRPITAIAGASCTSASLVRTFFACLRAGEQSTSGTRSHAARASNDERPCKYARSSYYRDADTAYRGHLSHLKIFWRTGGPHSIFSCCFRLDLRPGYNRVKLVDKIPLSYRNSMDYRTLQQARLVSATRGRTEA